MITNFFIPELNNHDVQELWFQQDGATCHTACATIDLLKDTFGDRLISRFGPVNWPPRSCDLTPLDYFLWGYVKSLVYADKPQTLDHLEDNIRRVIADIRPQMLEKVIENWTSRLDYIRGSPMPEIIFEISDLDPDVRKRIRNIIQYLTYEVYRYAVRGFYECHRFLFVLMLALKLQLESGSISYIEFFTFVKGGASLDMNSVRPKPYTWIPDVIWLNIVQLSRLTSFKTLVDEVCTKEAEWKTWFESEVPEAASFPCGYDAKLDPFGILLMIRTWCPDRTLSQAKKFISASLGPEFVEGVLLDYEDLWWESDNRTPLICLLSTSGDPSMQVELLARKKELEYSSVSMGQGQEIPARRILSKMSRIGGWVILQNCHLSLDFCYEVLEMLSEENEVHESFRLWITTEMHPQFPIGLLQLSIKFTNEPPQGVKVSLKRTYASLPDDILEYSNAPQWQPLLFGIAFLNTIVQERRKFGPLGWNIPYEFNQADFSASMKFLQKHLDDMDMKKGPCWRTIRFMLAEVKYGGRVTDDYDKRLLCTYMNEWFNEKILHHNFEFYPGYRLPQCNSLKQCLEGIKKIPDDDCPQVFGLHANANITKVDLSVASQKNVTQVLRGSRLRPYGLENQVPCQVSSSSLGIGSELGDPSPIVFG
ncbi:dynein heavy chain 8, axonemal [Trichonephila clavipes]|nr:dynein heavy chain 8, axonemal [Trichonephila clavipes]